MDLSIYQPNTQQHIGIGTGGKGYSHFLDRSQKHRWYDRINPFGNPGGRWAQEHQRAFNEFIDRSERVESHNERVKAYNKEEERRHQASLREADNRRLASMRGSSPSQTQHKEQKRHEFKDDVDYSSRPMDMINSIFGLLSAIQTGRYDRFAHQQINRSRR